MRAYNQGWGYKIDYAKEIANDLKEIAATERHVPLAAALTDEERAQGNYHLSVYHWLMSDVPARAPLLGLTQADVVDLAWFADFGMPETTEPPAGWYSRAVAIDKRLEAEFGSYVIRDPQAMLKALRSRLARHRRNQRKWEG